jgi:hypothetical protein
LKGRIGGRLSVASEACQFPVDQESGIGGASAWLRVMAVVSNRSSNRIVCQSHLPPPAASF